MAQAIATTAYRKAAAIRNATYGHAVFFPSPFRVDVKACAQRGRFNAYVVIVTVAAPYYVDDGVARVGLVA